jgi:hypothetical protein
MKVRTAITGMARRPARTVAGWAILAVLVAAAVSACTSNPGTTSVYLPTASSSQPPSDGTTSPATSDTTPTPSVSATVSQTVTVTVTITPSYSQIPTAAPVTGGGGTAGLQDGVLFIIGGLAIVVGAGSFLYRRMVSKDR